MSFTYFKIEKIATPKITKRVNFDDNRISTHSPKRGESPATNETSTGNSPTELLRRSEKEFSLAIDPHCSTPNPIQMDTNPSVGVDLVEFYKQNYKTILADRTYSEIKFRLNHEDTSMEMDRFHPEYFHYLKHLAKAYKTTLQSHFLFSNKNKPIDENSFKEFQIHLAMLVYKFSKTVNMRMAAESCKDYQQNQELIKKCQSDLDDCDGDIEQTITKIFLVKTNSQTDTFNEYKMRTFYHNDREFPQLLDLALNGVDFELDPEFIRNTSVEPIRKLQKELQKVYEYHVDKLIMKDRAIILDLRKIREDQKNKLHICSLHLVPKPSSDTLPIDPNSNDRKGRLCFDQSNRHDKTLALNGGQCKELNIAKYGGPTNPNAAQIVLRWIYWKLKYRYKWNQCYLCRQDVEAAFNRLILSPRRALLMTAALSEHLIVIHHAGNFGHSSLPSAYGIISRATKRLIERNPNFKGVLSVICDDYIFLTLKEDHEEANKIVIDVVENKTLGKGAISQEKKLEGQIVGTYGFQVNLVEGSIRPMDKGLHKLQASFWLFDIEQRQHVSLWQGLASLSEYYSHALRGTRPLVRIFENMVTTCTPYADSKAKASPLAKAIIELWRIITLVLFFNKEAFNVTLEDFIRSYKKIDLSDKWEEIENLENKPSLRIRMKSDAGPNFVGAAIYAICPSSKIETMLAYTCVHMPFDDPTNLFQGLREYIGLLVSLLLAQSYKIQQNSYDLNTYVEWYGDNSGAIDWAKYNKAKSRVAQCVNLLITWFPLITNISLSFSKHIPGIIMVKEGIDALSRPELGVPHNFPPHLEVDLQQKMEDSGILTLCTPHYNSQSVENVHSLFKELNDSLHSFFYA